MTQPVAHEGQAPIIHTENDPRIYGALTGAILVLTSVIALLWRRGEKHRDRMLKAAEEAREREVARTNELADRLTEERGEFAQVIEQQRTAFAEALEAQRESLIAVIDRERDTFAATLRTIVERQAQADASRDAKLAEIISQQGKVIEAAQHRIARREPRG